MIHWYPIGYSRPFSPLTSLAAATSTHGKHPDFQDFSRWRDPDSNRGHHDFSPVLYQLSDLAARSKLVHINNTNPVLLERSPERDVVLRAGVEVGYDGLDVDL